MSSTNKITYSDDLSKLPHVFKENGFALVESVFTEAEADEMKAEMATIVESLDLEDHPKSIFRADDEDRHSADRYFLNSASNISHFYEGGAVDEDGKVIVPKDRAFNKIGHALHWLNPVFKKFSFHSNLQNVIRSLDYKHPKIVQSMYIFKIGGAVGSHVDSTFLRTDPVDNLVGLWIALDDATVGNGCLWFIPGSHKSKATDYRFVRVETKNSADPLVKFVGQKPTYESQEFVPVEVKKGSMVLIHGLVVHKSEANTSPLSRHAYTLHVADTSSVDWDPLNWMQETADFKFPALY